MRFLLLSSKQGKSDSSRIENVSKHSEIDGRLFAIDRLLIYFSIQWKFHIYLLIFLLKQQDIFNRLHDLLVFISTNSNGLQSIESPFALEPYPSICALHWRNSNNISTRAYSTRNDYLKTPWPQVNSLICYSECARMKSWICCSTIQIPTNIYKLVELIVVGWLTNPSEILREMRDWLVLLFRFVLDFILIAVEMWIKYWLVSPIHCIPRMKILLEYR